MDIAIVSGKGGTGKTTLSTNLSRYIADSKKMVLVDLDVEEPNTKLFIDAEQVSFVEQFVQKPFWLKDNCVMCGQCSEHCNFNAIISLPEKIMTFPQLCHSCYACAELCPQDALQMKDSKIGVLKEYQNDNLSLIESRLEVGEINSVALISKTKDFVHENFSNDIIKIFDCPPGAACPLVESIKDVEKVIIVAEDSLFGLNDLKIIVETIKYLNKDYSIIINKYTGEDSILINFCTINKIKIITKIPLMREIATKYSEGSLIYPYVDKFRVCLKDVVDYINN